jgi:hypothetical protein
VEHHQDPDHPTFRPPADPRRPAAATPPADPTHPAARAGPDTEPGTIHPGWRVAAGLGAVASVPAVAIAWFAGVVVYSGCFIKCDEAAANPFGGFLLFLLAGACLVVGAVCTKLALTGRTEGTGRVAWVSALVGLLAALLSAAS